MVVKYAYRGYEYQIDVSVWCALHLMFERKICELLQIEPASLEDIEAELFVDPKKAETFSTTSAGKLKIIIQIKSRSSGPWNVSDISNMLFRNMVESGHNEKEEHFSRLSPVQQLINDKDAVFVLITDADVSENLKLFRIEQVGNLSQANTFPATLKNKILNQANNSELARRITIFPRFIWDYAKKQSEEILQYYGNVPIQLVGECRQTIAEALRKRLLGKTDSLFIRDELEDIIRRSSGLPQKSTVLNYHVMPFTQNKAREILDNYHALLIYGEPGIGKSLFAEALTYEHRKMTIPFKVVTEIDMPRGVLIAFQAGGPVIAFLDDPWGKISPGQHAVDWRSNIIRLLKEARSDRKIIVVSRQLVLEDIYPDIVPSELRKIAFRLDSEAYREKELKEMVEKRLNSIVTCSLKQKQYFWENWSEISSSLTYPVELIAVAERICENPLKNPADLKQLIAQCKRENLVQTYVEELSAKPYHERLALSVAWILTNTSSKTWLEDSRIFRDWILSSNLKPAEGLPLKFIINHLIKIGWLREDQYRGLYLRDPRIEEALNVFFKRYPEDIQDLITFIFSKLSEIGRIPDALRMIEALVTRELRPTKVVLKTLDNWLIQNALSCPSNDFPVAWRSLGNWYVSDDPCAVFARAFNESQLEKTKRPEKRKSGIDFESPYFNEWSIKHTQEIKICDKCKTLAEKLIREYFPDCDEIFHAKKVIEKYYQLGWRFPEACLSATTQMLTGVRHSNPWLLSVFATGLKLWGIDEQLEQALNLIVEEHKKVSDQYKQWEKEYSDKLEEGILDAGYEAHLLEQPSDMFGPFDDTLDILVAGLAQRKGPDWLVQMVENDHLFSSCCRALCEINECYTEDTLRIFFSCAKEPWQRREIWRAAGKAKLNQIIPELIEAFGSVHVDEVRGALEGLAKLYDAPEFGIIVSKRSGELDFVGKCRLSEALKNIEGPVKFVSPEKYRQMVTIKFTDIEQKLLDNLPRDKDTFDSIKKSWRVFDETCRDYAIELAYAEDLPNSFRALALAACGLDRRILPIAKDWSSCKDKKHRVMKLQAVIQFPGEHAEALEKALKDPHYSCRRFAIERLTHLADKNESLKRKIINMANNDLSAPVREKCVKIIGQYGWTDGITALLNALKDTRNRSEGWEDQPEHHVARAAGEQLDVFHLHGDLLIEPLLEFLNSGSKTQSDVTVHVSVILTLRNWNNHSLVIKALSELLLDDWYVKAHQKNGYIRRMAAAWALVGTSDKKTFQHLKSIITDFDDRVTGPAMIALANYGDLGIAQINRILEFEDVNVSRERKLLALTILILMNKNVPKEILNLFSVDMAIAKWLLLLTKNPKEKGKVPIQEWMQVDPFLSDPLQMLKQAGGLGPSFYFLLKELFGVEFENICSFMELINHTMPESIKTLSIRHFIGCE